jgi:hypothetical protein
VTSPGDGDDAYWRRPSEAAETDQPTETGQPGTGAAGTPHAKQPYTGPPPTQPPPRGWRTPHVTRPAPPRALPEQDLVGLDEAERGARTLTLGIGMIAGAVVLILSCLLCSRVLF